MLIAGARLESAHLTLAAAVCLGRMDDAARLVRDASPADRQMALAACAALNGKTRAIAMLIDLGVDVNAYNQGLHPHATALHSACLLGFLGGCQVAGRGWGRTSTRETRPTEPRPLVWAEYYVSGEEKGDRPTKQYSEIAAYLRETGSKR